jgi:hypothetical protein
MFFAWVAALVPVLVFVAAVWWDRRQRRAMEKPPQSGKLLRPPGHSLSLRLDTALDGIMFDLAIACALSAGFAGCCFDFAAATVRHVPLDSLLIRAAIAVPVAFACSFFAVRAFRRFHEAQNIRLGLRGEQAVAGALQEAAECGFRSFHDIPGDAEWNIDHVAVGTRGVFLVETKARRKRGSSKGQAAHEVIYDGNALQFPSYRDAKPIDQARRNAKWLSNYLSHKTGELVQVVPLVVLPGWFVTLSVRGSFAVRVMNTTFLPGYLQREVDKIEAAQVRRIIAALDEKCRDLEF